MKIASIALSFVLFLTACGKKENSNILGEPATRADSEKKFNDGKVSFFAIGEDKLKEKINSRAIQTVTEEKAKSYLNSLAVKKINKALPKVNSPFMTVGVPANMLKEQYLFGGVITKVSDRLDEDLGGLKLTDLEPIHITLSVVKAESDNYGVLMSGCLRNCNERSIKRDIFALPIVAVDLKNETLVLDVAALGAELNLVEILDPQGRYTQLKTQESKVTLVDYAYSTLVFDVEANMVPLKPKPDEKRRVKFTTRWYLRLSSFVSPSFAVREAKKGVGFFTTSRSEVPKIQRFALTEETRRVHYYVKNVPDEYRASFASAFDRWNTTFKQISGQPIFTYEFVAKNDPRNEYLVAGDIRFNIIEWDLINSAPYGGLGPAVFHQFTGENLSANVLIQGPMVVQIYSEWFNVNAQAMELKRGGRVQEAEALLARFRKSHPFRDRLRKQFRLNLQDLDFKIHSLEHAYEDPIADRLNFDEIPLGYSFQKYMNGYFHEMVAHELGHNLGLRHNFKGNFGADETKNVVSNSVMEYMGKLYRHKNDIGEYDVMAIEYGYLGKEPARTNLFCTDEDAVQGGGIYGLQGSPECSRSDATADAFSYYESILEKGVNLLLAKHSKEASLWTAKEMQHDIIGSVLGVGFYGALSEGSEHWEHFFQKPDRPKDSEKIKKYVGQRVHQILCNKSIADAIANKGDETAKAETAKKIEDLRTFVRVIFNNLSLELPEFKDCETL